MGWDEGVGTMVVPCSGPRGKLGLMVTGREIRVPLFESTMMEGWLGAGINESRQAGQILLPSWPRGLIFFWSQASH